MTLHAKPLAWLYPWIPGRILMPQDAPNHPQRRSPPRGGLPGVAHAAGSVGRLLETQDELVGLAVDAVIEHVGAARVVLVAQCIALAIQHETGGPHLFLHRF